MACSRFTPTTCVTAFQGLRVSPKFRGQGVSKILAARTKAEVEGSGAERIRVSTHCKEPDAVTDNFSFRSHLKQGWVAACASHAHPLPHTVHSSHARRSFVGNSIHDGAHTPRPRHSLN